MKYTMKEFRIPREGEYTEEVQEMFFRDTLRELKPGRFSVTRKYTVGGRPFIVCSIYDLYETRSVVDGVKRLIDIEFEKEKEQQNIS